MGCDKATVIVPSESPGFATGPLWLALRLAPLMVPVIPPLVASIA